MGRAIIQSHLGAGRYWVDIKYNTAMSDAMIAQMQQRVAALDVQIPLLETAIADEELKYNQAELTSPPAEWKVLYAIRQTINGYQRKRRSHVIERASLTQKMTSLQALTDTVSREAWCADLTENINGEVGTIEPEGVAGAPIIQPGYAGNAAYSKTRDGCLQHAMATVPEATFWNLALLPGWQKWRPLYRTGIITILDTANDTATVVLDAAVSTQHPWGKDIDLNVEETLEAIPVEYMTCNAQAFTVGDHCVVRFEGQNWDNPKVIGFVDNPKPCGEYVYFHMQIYTGGGASVKAVMVWDIAGQKPFESGGFTVPCSADDPAYVAWRSGMSNAGQSLFNSQIVVERTSADLLPLNPGSGETKEKRIAAGMAPVLPSGEDYARQTLEELYDEDDNLVWQRIFNHVHINAWGSPFTTIKSLWSTRQQDYDEGDSPIPAPEYSFIRIADRINYETHSLNGVRQEFDDTFYVKGAVEDPIAYDDCYRDLSMGDDLWGYDLIPEPVSSPPVGATVERIGTELYKFDGYGNEPITFYAQDDPDDPTLLDPPPYGGNIQAKFVFDFESRDYIHATYPPYALEWGVRSEKSIAILDLIYLVPKLEKKRKYQTIITPWYPEPVITPYYNIEITYEDRVVLAAAYVAAGSNAARDPLPDTLIDELSTLVVDTIELAYTLAGLPKNMWASGSAYTEFTILKKT